MVKYSWVVKFLYWARDLMSPELYQVIARYLSGQVLDVGGALFVEKVIKKQIPFNHWTTLEISTPNYQLPTDPRVRFVIGDGCRLEYSENSFDTVLNIQVLEHTFEPFLMFRECIRVLKPGKYAIFLIPQTGVMHLAPHHYQNFLRFWIIEAAQRCSCEIVELLPLGGWWATIASRLIYFFPAFLRMPGSSVKDIKRSIWFYILVPAMIIYALINIPILIILSIGDLKEEPMNHLVVIKKM